VVARERLAAAYAVKEREYHKIRGKKGSPKHKIKRRRSIQISRGSTPEKIFFSGERPTCQETGKGKVFLDWNLAGRKISLLVKKNSITIPRGTRTPGDIRKDLSPPRFRRRTASKGKLTAQPLAQV